MGSIAISAQRETVTDYTLALRESKFGILSHKPLPISKNLALLGPFRYMVWILTILSLVVIVPVFYLVVRGLNKEREFNFATCALQCIRVLLNQSKNIFFNACFHNST